MSILLYLFGVNLVAFILYTIDFRLHIRSGREVRPQVLLNLATIAGGAAGALLAYIVWDRRINKQNIQSRVYALCWLALQALILYILCGPRGAANRAWLLQFYETHRLLCIYLAAINLVTFVAFGLDKAKAVLHIWRIRETVLLGLSLIGGAAGALLAMDLFNHKVRSLHFMFGVPAMLSLHLLLLACLALGLL